MRHSTLLVVCMLGTCAVLLVGAAGQVPLPAVAATGNQGLNVGWVVGDTGARSFPHAAPSQLPIVTEAGAGWVRVNFRLGECYADWTSPILQLPLNWSPGDPTCDAALYAAHATILPAYDAAIQDARGRGLQVLGVLSNEIVHGDQITDWQANDAEVDGGNGNNGYLQRFASTAGMLAAHFNGSNGPRVGQWEIWNEPNAWEQYDAAGHIWGSSFIYPSNFAWLLRQSYEAITRANPAAAVMAGAVLGTDIGGMPMNVVVKGKPQQIIKHGETPPALHPSYASACTSTVPSGADYLCDTYRAGLNFAEWQKPYPFHHLGQHFYIDQGYPTKSLKIASLLEDVRHAYVAFEGGDTTKQTHVTEFGWQANPSSLRYAGDASMQAENLRIAYTTLANAGYVARGYWYDVQDIQEGANYFGLVGNAYRAGDSSPANLALRKPAFAAYQRNAL